MAIRLQMKPWNVGYDECNTNFILLVFAESKAAYRKIFVSNTFLIDDVSTTAPALRNYFIKDNYIPNIYWDRATKDIIYDQFL